jgi:hypothetical protein
MIQNFDWAECAKLHPQEVVWFLRSVQHTEISQDDFVIAYQKLPRLADKPKRGSRSPSKLRGTYRNLRDKFGFFQPPV